MEVFNLAERVFEVKNTGRQNPISGVVMDLKSNPDGTATMIVGQNGDEDGNPRRRLVVKYVPGGPVLGVNELGIKDTM